MPVKVKICGLTTLWDARRSAELGADYLGFVLYPKSPRFILPERAFEIISELPEEVKKVAVVVNADADMVNSLLEGGFDLVQLHGDEKPEILKKVPASRVIKVFRISDAPPPEEELRRWEGVYAFLLDTYKKGQYGGTGETFDWEAAATLSRKGYKIFLSGGLTPENVTEAVRRVKPYAVDVSSGVELTKGKKDLEKVKRFIENAKGVSL
jgi:phosphoribosylanthranilate isomerase